jgi:hypothetical protein
MYCRVVKYMLTDVSEVRPASIIRAMMEAVRTSETLVNIYLTTRQYTPGQACRTNGELKMCTKLQLGSLKGETSQKTDCKREDIRG